MKLQLAIALAVSMAACGDDSPRPVVEGDDGGTLVIAMPAGPTAIFPPFAFDTHGKLVAEQIYDHLADVGPDLNTIGDAGFRGELAERWTWSDDSLSIAFHINPRARWHDGRPVTARDVKFTIALYANPALGGQTVDAHARIDSVTSADSLTVVFWFPKRSPVQFLDAAAQVPILPAHVLESIPANRLRTANPPLIGSGRFKLKRWERGKSGEIVADSGNYRGRARLDRVIWTSGGSTTAVAKLLSGEADVFDTMRPEDVVAASRNPLLRVVALPGLDYVFMHFNLRDPAQPQRPHPLFASRELRRAITMAVDRSAVVRSLLDTLAAVALGPTVRAYPTTDSSLTPIPFDTARANATFDSLGWRRRGPDEIRVRDGRPLAFSVIVPSPSINRVRAAVLLQAQLRRAGIRMDIDQMDNAAFGQRWTGRRFEAAIGAFNMGATAGATNIAWGAPGLSKGGLNFGSYSNPRFDAAVDSALGSTDPRLSRSHFTRAYQIINDDAPAVWLYEVKNVIGIHRRIRVTRMRPGAWWTDLASWSIPAAERLQRDLTPSAR